MSEAQHEVLQKFALLDLIEQTDRFAANTVLWASWLSDRRPSDAKLYADEHHQSLATINEAITSLGGLTIGIEDAEGRPLSELRLGEWLGRDPDEPDKHLWRPFGSSKDGPYFSITADALTEMRDKLLDEFDADV